MQRPPAQCAPPIYGCVLNAHTPRSRCPDLLYEDGESAEPEPVSRYVSLCLHHTPLTLTPAQSLPPSKVYVTPTVCPGPIFFGRLSPHTSSRLQHSSTRSRAPVRWAVGRQLERLRMQYRRVLHGRCVRRVPGRECCHVRPHVPPRPCLVSLHRSWEQWILNCSNNDITVNGCASPLSRHLRADSAQVPAHDPLGNQRPSLGLPPCRGQWDMGPHCGVG